MRRMLSWENKPSSPTQTTSSVYDGEGQRIQQIVTNSGTTTTTNYIQGIEEIATTGSTTTITKYYNAGLVQAVSVNGSVTYLVPDALGSISEDLDTSGNVLAEQLFGPYGNVRYSAGSMPGSHGYTGQVQDASGLSYFNARYYDPAVGQFTSADTVQGPNRYGYVAGNPETLTDPSGMMISAGSGSGSSTACMLIHGECYNPYTGPILPPCTGFCSDAKTMKTTKTITCNDTNATYYASECQAAYARDEKIREQVLLSTEENVSIASLIFLITSFASIVIQAFMPGTGIDRVITIIGNFISAVQIYLGFHIEGYLNATLQGIFGAVVGIIAILAGFYKYAQVVSQFSWIIDPIWEGARLSIGFGWGTLLAWLANIGLGYILTGASVLFASIAAHNQIEHDDIARMGAFEFCASAWAQGACGKAPTFTLTG